MNHYRFVCQVPEGQYNDERRAAVTGAMTQAVLAAHRQQEAELLLAATGERAVT